MKKYKILIGFIVIAVILAVTAPQHEFPFDMKINGDLTIDSVVYLTTLPAVSTGDTGLVYDNGTVKYKIFSSASDSSLWSISSDTTYTKNSGAVRITGGDLYPSVDGTYDLGTSSYRWDTLFFSSVIEYSSDLIFSTDGAKMKLTSAGHLGVGDNSPDSAISTTGGKFSSDILVGGGWAAWTPTLVWTGGTTSAPTTVARYQVVNNTVHFTLTIDGSNTSGNTLTALNVTLPIFPKDVNVYVPVPCIVDPSGKVMTDGSYEEAFIDATDGTEGNRKLYIFGLSIANAADYLITCDGFYEITRR